MSLLGVDIGTSGVRAVVFSETGEALCEARGEYRPRGEPAAAELDAGEVWSKAKAVIARAASGAGRDPVKALAVASLGEAMVPVSADRRLLGPSILAIDPRGGEYLPRLRAAVPDQRLFAINGNTLGNIFGLTKLMWTRDRRAALYRDARYFLNWSGCAAYLLGGAPAVDFSLANRSLLFDLDARGWSRELFDAAGLDVGKLPSPVPAGTPLGTVSAEAAAELGLPAGTVIVAGAHDQCANSLGCGVVDPGSALLGMGTYLCAVPVYDTRPPAAIMMELGLNTEHHAVPGRFVSFIYNMSGAIVRWYRDTFAAAEHAAAAAAGTDVYDRLFAELPEAPSLVSVLPHWSPMGPPDFITGSSGVIAGLTLGTRRGEILKGILQAAVFSVKDCLDLLPRAGIRVDEYRAAGGGSRSAAWIQLCADILGRPVTKPRVTEAGALGAAMLAGIGAGIFASAEQACAAMVRVERTFPPDAARAEEYAQLYARHCRLWPLLREYLTGEHSDHGAGN